MFVAGNQLLLVLVGVGIGVAVLAVVIIIALVIIKKKRSPANNVAKTESTNLPKDYVELSTPKPSNYAGLNAEQTDGSTEGYDDVNSPSTNSAYYEGARSDDYSDPTYSQISNYVNQSSSNI